ncbi:MAG: xanthine dehydrogenase family protein molybdopterin-binding subunit, partial [SAR202 cluster bacterium]|nr:xanthine dehydrogenase family protein molybdopterin-binding subunit [SAR202 cluster bacterium]
MATTQDSPRKFRVLDTSPIRHDGLDKVTGRAQFGADFHMQGTLHGKILRSPHAHARILSIDTSKAEALPGVKAVVTASDFPIMSQPLDLSQANATPRATAENDLACDKALYRGHAVAAVAATSTHIAEDALDLIEVDYEVLPHVLDVQEAMKGDAPILHKGLTTMFRTENLVRGDDTGVEGNIAGHVQAVQGDVEEGFKQADLIVERELTTTMVHQGYIEPFAATVFWSPDDRLTIWTSTQNAFGMRATVSTILALPESSVKVVQLEVGGGFGGRGTGYMEPVAAILSKKSAAPVKMVMTRKEVFEATGPTSGTFIRCKIGVDNDGYIKAAQMFMAYEAGAYPGSPVGNAAFPALGAYKIAHTQVDGYDVVVNKPKTQSYRAPGQPQANHAVETVMDEIAEKLGMDPMELRLKNVIHEGDMSPSGLPHSRFGCEEIMDAMKQHPHYNGPLDGPNQGRGVAVAYRTQDGGYGSSATINVNDNGTINLITGSADLSGTRVALAMQAAENLGIDVEDVNPSVTDTDSVGFTGGSYGSHVTFETGWATLKAANMVIDQMKERASLLWEVQPEEVDFTDGVFACKLNSEDRLTFKEMAGEMSHTGGTITCSASNIQSGVGSQVASNIVDVEVDPDTGKVDILRYTTFMDV